MKDSYNVVRLYATKLQRYFSAMVCLLGSTPAIVVLALQVGGDALRDALSKCNWNEETPKIVTIFWKLYLPRESRLEVSIREAA